MRLNIIRQLTALLFLFLVVFTAPLARSEQWRLYPSFDNTPHRIIDTERYTYFQVSQRYYELGVDCYNTPVAVMLRYDKTNPAEGIEPLVRKVGVSQVNVHLAEYSPEGKFLAMLYGNGEMDIVYENGDVHTTKVLPSIGIPESQRINSMTVCGTQIWISTATGYIVIEGKTGVVLNRSDLRTSVEWIGMSENSGAAIMGGVLKVFDASRHPGRSVDFTSLNIPGLPGAPLALMPLGNNAFAFLANKKTTGTHSLNVIYKEGGEWKYSFLRDLWLDPIAQKYQVANSFERNCVRNKNGWLIYTEGHLIHVDGTKSAIDPAMVTVIPTSRKITMAGAWDTTGGWVYKDRGEFVYAPNDGTYIQINDEAAIRPDLPEASVANYMTYTPEAGVVVCNFGHSRMFYNMARTTPGPSVSAYRNGKWKRISQSVNVPYSAEQDGPNKTLYESRRDFFPLSTPTGIAADPVFQEFVWLGSSFYGFAALDCLDPKRDPIHYGATNDPLAAYPGFKGLLEPCKRWGMFNPVSVPSFDADGVLWAAEYHFDASYDDLKNAVRLHYITPEARLNAMEGHDAALTGETGWIGIDAQNDLDSSVKCQALTHPNNKNIVLSYILNEDRTIAVVDHKGTLADTSDDEQKQFYWIDDQNGVEWYVLNCNSIAEDPLTGEVWLATGQTLVSFDPHSPVVDHHIKGKSLNILTGEDRGNIFENLNTHCIAFDEYGRMWVSANHGGVWGISADRTEIIARYTTSNSPLPDDTTYAMVWNPDNKSLMVSTAAGLAEVWPDAGGVTKKGYSPLIVPQSVMPDYTGTVTVGGLKPYVDIRISDPKGSVIRKLSADATGTAIWDLRNDAGDKVESGHYVIQGDFSPVDIPVLR